ncbi:MAG TPA: alpha/beta fold hydrolase [Solirubrobacteraceae bacterium]|nr:alpha/beta fold hydrolase [Solirubrobacteraceae bacterium]
MDSYNDVQVSEDLFVLPSDALQDLSRRLAEIRLPPDLGSGWERGVPRAWLRSLLEDWRGFDTAALQNRIDALRHLRVDIDGQMLHVVHAQGRGPHPLPLLLTHGWPGSFLEYLRVLPLLCEPGAHAADPADAFTVIVPSLPGFGFSGPPPPDGLTGREVARLWHALMTRGLGYDRYVAHGSDLGAGVTGWLARDHPQAVAAIHLATPGLAVAPAPRTRAEDEFAAAVQVWTTAEGAYAHQHATKPTTLGAALSDSPAGLAAWIAEKVIAWSSTRPDGSPAFDPELLLATLTLYWATQTITTSLLPYWANRHNSAAAMPADEPAAVATAISIFGGERVPFPKPPRQLAERYYTVTAWAEHPVGGHFPAVAEPELLARSLRDAFRPAR